MRVLSITLVWMVAMLFSSCSKENKGVTFTYAFNAETVIPSSTGINLPINILAPDLTTNSGGTFEANQTTPALVRDIKMKQLELKIKSPNQTTFDFLRSIRIYMSADGLAEREIAWATDIPENGTRSLLLTTDLETNYKEYIVKESVSLRVQATTRQLLTSDTRLEILPTFEVRASLRK
ncbi:MAG: hypothetical protein Q8J69_09030 [Sphingobacteriaceae bacterium]|nr:hypothetical protein [Sphingobacteriaceae bacterium]